MYKDNEAKLHRNIYNGVELIVDHSFGWTSVPIESNGLFISEENQTIVYPSGGHLATYDILTKKNEYIQRSDANASIVTAMSTGLTKKRDIVIGIGEKDKNSEVSPKIKIYFYTHNSEEGGEWVLKLQSDHSHIEDLNESSYVSQIIIPDFNKYWVTLCKTNGSSPIVSYFKYESGTVHRYGSVSDSVKQIAINPFSNHSFIAIGDKYVRSYMATEKKKKFAEDKEAVIPRKYETTNDFTDIKFLLDSHAFVLVSTQCNIFIINGKSVVYIRFTQSPSVVLEVNHKTSPTETVEVDPLQLEDLELIVETHK